jgi:hypothetical protein
LGFRVNGRRVLKASWMEERVRSVDHGGCCSKSGNGHIVDDRNYASATYFSSLAQNLCHSQSCRICLILLRSPERNARVSNSSNFSYTTLDLVGVSVRRSSHQPTVNLCCSGDHVLLFMKIMIFAVRLFIQEGPK